MWGNSAKDIEVDSVAHEVDLSSLAAHNGMLYSGPSTSTDAHRLVVLLVIYPDDLEKASHLSSRYYRLLYPNCTDIQLKIECFSLKNDADSSAGTLLAR